VAPESLEDWLEPLGRFCDLGEPAILRKPNGQPISWRIDGALRQAEALRPYAGAALA
jgi:hypothetical protein